jgi:uncharacterized protein YeaO (DUF488 family)
VNEIRTRRVYDPPSPDDGARLLVDRLWPRGVKKQKLRLAGWLKELAPSDSLRKWFAHDPANWAEFQRRYFAQLEENPMGWQPILKAAREGTVTLVFSAKDAEHNNAVALKRFLEAKNGKKGSLAS